MIERTFTIFKPDALRKGVQGHMLQRLLDEGFTLRGLKMLHLSKTLAEAFYAVHKERSFFPELVEFMTSGPVVVASLERENAVAHLRAVMGPTDSTKAPKETIRGQFGTDIQCNAIHGSDSVENGLIETAFFFSGAETVSAAPPPAKAAAESAVAPAFQSNPLDRPPKGR
jgi:nucleoside-diphosphate kinase